MAKLDSDREAALTHAEEPGIPDHVQAFQVEEARNGGESQRLRLAHSCRGGCLRLRDVKLGGNCGEGRVVRRQLTLRSDATRSEQTRSFGRHTGNINTMRTTIKLYLHLSGSRDPSLHPSYPYPSGLAALPYRASSLSLLPFCRHG